MKTLVLSGVLLSPTLLIASNIPAVGVAYLCLLVYASKHNQRLGRFWLRAYKETLRLEDKIFKS